MNVKVPTALSKSIACIEIERKKQNALGESSGSHGGEWDVVLCSLLDIDRRFRGEDGCHPGCSAVLSGRSLLIPLMMEAASTSETLVIFYQTSRRNIPEDSHLQYSP
jgi:hypothetical protein